MLILLSATRHSKSIAWCCLYPALHLCWVSPGLRSGELLLKRLYSYLTFQLFTHSYYYKPQATEDGDIVVTRPQTDNVFRLPSWHSSSSNASDDGESSSSDSSEDDDGVHQPKLKVSYAIVLLTISSKLLSFNRDSAILI